MSFLSRKCKHTAQKIKWILWKHIRWEKNNGWCIHWYELFIWFNYQPTDNYSIKGTLKSNVNKLCGRLVHSAKGWLQQLTTVLSMVCMVPTCLCACLTMSGSWWHNGFSPRSTPRTGPGHHRVLGQLEVQSTGVGWNSNISWTVEVCVSLHGQTITDPPPNQSYVEQCYRHHNVLHDVSRTLHIFDLRSQYSSVPFSTCLKAVR